MNAAKTIAIPAIVPPIIILLFAINQNKLTVRIFLAIFHVLLIQSLI